MAGEQMNGKKKRYMLIELIALDVGSLVSIVTLLDFFETKLDISLLGNKFLSICLIFVSTTLFSYLAIYLRHVSERKPSDESSLAGSFLDSISAAYKAEKWQEVIKIGSVLSRPLWLTGYYELRLKIGGYVESAAAFAKEDKVQATALIDDLGWTNVALGNLEKARSYIEHGIAVAQDIKDYYLVSKAYRHLSGIAAKKRNLQQADLMSNKAREALLKLPMTSERRELEAGLFVNGAMRKMDQGNWSEALEDIGQARSIYRELGDEDREVKLYSLEGNCRLNLEELNEALDSFRDGLAIAERRCRKDAILSNLQGIGQTYERLGEYEKAIEHFKLAKAAAKELRNQTIIEEIEKEIKRLEKTI